MSEGAQKSSNAQKEANIQRETARPPHGGDVYGENIYGGSFNDVSVYGGNTSARRIHGGGIRYDFTANTGPLGMPEGVKEALRRDIDRWDIYPDPYCRALTAELSAHTRSGGSDLADHAGAAAEESGDLRAHIFRIREGARSGGKRDRRIQTGGGK